MNREITIHVRLDAKTFRRFCHFDGLWLRRRWARPLVFALLLGAFAAVALLSGREQSGLIAGVLLAVGLGLPLVYIGSFLTQINRQVKRYGLKSPRAVYTVRLSPDAMRVTNDQKKEAPLEAAWKDAWAAYRVRGCIYLYAAPARAFLLPDGQADADADAVWAYLSARMGDRCRDRR